MRQVTGFIALAVGILVYLNLFGFSQVEARRDLEYLMPFSQMLVSVLAVLLMITMACSVLVKLTMILNQPWLIFHRLVGIFLILSFIVLICIPDSHNIKVNSIDFLLALLWFTTWLLVDAVDFNYAENSLLAKKFQNDLENQNTVN